MDINAKHLQAPTVYDVLKYLFDNYKPELLCEVCPQLFSELERFGYAENSEH